MEHDKVSVPLISIIVPVYNIEKYIKKCIKSIINQTYKNIEIILVDDGSTDSSGKICDKYSLLDKRIKVIHKKNGGLVSARKSGIQMASGDYAAYVDGDDWIESNMYEQLLKEIMDADIIVSGIIREYTDFSICCKNNIAAGFYSEEKLINNIYTKMVYTGRFFESGLLPYLWHSLFRRKLLLNNQMQVDNRICIFEDAACFYPTILDANKIVLSSHCFYHYRIREGSLMSSMDSNELNRFKIWYDYLYNCFSQKKALSNILLHQLNYYVIYYLILRNVDLFQKKNDIFPYSNIKLGSKIIIYGKGRFGKIFINSLKSRNNYTIVSWIDSKTIVNENINLENLDFDYIILAILNPNIIDEILNQLKILNVPLKKIKTLDIKNIESAIKEINLFLHYDKREDVNECNNF